MEETVSVDIRGEKRPQPAPARRRLPLAGLIGALAGLVGIAALGASAWVYGETRRDIMRLSTDIAQLRVSMELFGRQQGTPSGADNASLTDLSNRLAIIEENWRGAPGSASLPAIPAAAAPTPVEGGDCLPTGMRFLVSAGDSYPVCGNAGRVEIGAVDNGFIALGDGTVIAAGGNIALPGTACMIGVVSAGEGGMTGFAEIRVTC